MTDDDQITVPKRSGYTVIPNGVLPEGQISARAWGVYAYLLSRPDGWIIRVPHLQTVFKEGRGAIYSAIHELCELGLMVKTTDVIQGGTPVTRFRLVVHEVSASVQIPGNGIPKNGIPKIDTVNQYREVTTTESNHPHYSQQPIADLSTTHPAASENERKKERSDPIFLSDRFDEFWSVYPRKTAKGQARKAWPAAVRKANPEVIIKGAMRYRDDPNRTDRFTKHPATWLNGECWADEPLPVMVEQQNGNGQPVDRLAERWRYVTMRCGCGQALRVDTVTNQPTEPHQCAQVPAS